MSTAEEKTREVKNLEAKMELLRIDYEAELLGAWILRDGIARALKLIEHYRELDRLGVTITIRRCLENSRDEARAVIDEANKEAEPISPWPVCRTCADAIDPADGPYCASCRRSLNA